MHVETQYVLDSAMELGELTPLEYALAFATPAATARLDAALERNEYSVDLVGREMRAALEQTPKELQYALALQVLPTLPAAFNALVGRVNIVVRNKVLSDLGHAPSPLRFIVEDRVEPAEEKLFSSLSEVMPHLVQRVVDSRFAPLLARWTKDLALIEQASRWFNEGDIVVRRAEALALLREPQETFAEMARFARPEQNVKEKRIARGALKKVLKLFERTDRMESVQALVSGSEVVISHESSPFKFVLVPFKGDWLMRSTARAVRGSPFNIRLFTKSDVHLANLCVYFKETPVLDQLFALMMYVQSGQESEVLKTANWFGVDDASRVLAQLSECGAEDLHDKVFTVPGRGAIGLHVTAAPEYTTWAPFEGPVSSWLRTMLVPARHAFLVNDHQPLALAA